jgi:hypothetical protein
LSNKPVTDITEQDRSAKDKEADDQGVCLYVYVCACVCVCIYIYIYIYIYM